MQCLESAAFEREAAPGRRNVVLLDMGQDFFCQSSARRDQTAQRMGV